MTTLTDVEVARRLGVSTYTVRNWRYLGRGPAYLKVGRCVRYRLADVDAWAETIRITPSGSDASEPHPEKHA
jgi:excisionase family DNA binding protein